MRDHVVFNLGSYSLSLLRRIELILFILFLLLTLVSVMAYRLVVHESFVAIEAVQEKRDIERMRAVLARETQHMGDILADWALWDAAYAYMADSNSTFEKSNLTESTFESYRIELIMFVNKSNEVLYQSISDYRTHVPLQLNKFIDPVWREENLLVPLSAGVGTVIQGMVRTEEGPMLIEARNVHRSDESGPSRGILIFGRLLGPFAQKQIADQVQMDFRIYSLTGVSATGSDSVNDVRIERTDETTRVSLPIESIDGEAGFVIEFEHQRVISQRGQIAFNSFLAILIIATLVTLLVIRRFMQ